VPANSFDVVIVGGAAVGASIAFHAAEAGAGRLGIALVERDPSFARAASALSAASIREQFSAPENIRLSRYGWGFLSTMRERFGPAADPGLVERGYLILATSEGAATLAENHALQTRKGAAVAFLDAQALGRRFPWLATDGIAAGTLGLAREGWFDAATLVATLRREAAARGVALLTGEAAAVETEASRIQGVRLADGRRLACGSLVNAAGPAAGRLAALAGRPLPVEPRKRSVYVLDAPDAPSDMPLLADPSGFWARPEGRLFLAGYSPPPAEDGPADEHDFEPDPHLFEDVLWPLLAARVPAFERLRCSRAWAGHYDYNTLDQNGIVGPDPVLPNFLYANGFSGHGIQQAPGVGRAVAELLVYGRFVSLDLSALGYERIAANRPYAERAVI